MINSWKFVKPLVRQNVSFSARSLAFCAVNFAADDSNEKFDFTNQVHVKDKSNSNDGRSKVKNRKSHRHDSINSTTRSRTPDLNEAKHTALESSYFSALVDKIFEPSDNADLPFLPRYKCFPLPGTVAVKLIEKNEALDNFNQQGANVQVKAVIDRSLEDHQRQTDIFRQFIYTQNIAKLGNLSKILKSNKFQYIDKVNCAAYDCPILIRQDVFSRFPDLGTDNGQRQLTIIAVNEKGYQTKTKYNKIVKTKTKSNQRIALTLEKLLYRSLVEICSFLQASGHWAGIINPDEEATDQAFNGPTTLAESSDSATYLLNNLTVTNKGTCKIITQQNCHKISNKPITDSVDSPREYSGGSNHFVFTSAPPNSQATKLILDASSLNYNQDSADQKTVNSRTSEIDDGVRDDVTSVKTGDKNTKSSSHDVDLLLNLIGR